MRRFDLTTTEGYEAYLNDGDDRRVRQKESDFMSDTPRTDKAMTDDTKHTEQQDSPSVLNDGLVRKGLRHVIDDARSITAWSMEDDTVVFDFVNGEAKTTIRLSNHAVSAIYSLWIELRAKGIAA